MQNRRSPVNTLSRIVLAGAVVSLVGAIGLAQSPSTMRSGPVPGARPDASVQGDQQAAGGDDGRVFPLWDPFTPPQNPVTEAKRVLGKILFWDEQLSSDNTMSCGTCHIPSAGGNDPREGINPGYDTLFGNDDDVTGSPGVILSDENGEYLRSVLFDLLPQTTPRRSMSNLLSVYAGNLFWDGRAEGDFVDPVTGQTLAMSSCALEIQSMMPLVNDTEMAHTNRSLPELLTKLVSARPLALASQIPADMETAIAAYPSYPDLFAQAFGDPEITAGRIGFAIATYERTLIPDQTPWDLWNAGDDNAMTPQQKQGYDLFRESTCVNCHNRPLFTSNDFTVNGVRPVFEDPGRSGITNVNIERGAFRMSTLRNLGGRDRFMHTGGLTTMSDVFDFYAHRNGQSPFPENLDFRLRTPITFTPSQQVLVEEFIINGLTDPRTLSEEFPFDRPQLYSERSEPNPGLMGSGNSGSGSYTPQMIAVTPPNIGNQGFKIGVDFALGGAQAWVAISQSPPTNGVVAQDTLIGPIEMHGMSAGEGYGTLIYPIDDPAMEGQTFYMQWVVSDPSGADGFARSPAAKVTPFCTMVAPCSPKCIADMNGDGALDFFDVSAFLNAYNAHDPIADLDSNGTFDFFDVSGFLNAFAAGCP